MSLLSLALGQLTTATPPTEESGPPWPKNTPLTGDEPKRRRSISSSESVKAEERKRGPLQQLMSHDVATAMMMPATRVVHNAHNAPGSVSLLVATTCLPCVDVEYRAVAPLNFRMVKEKALVTPAPTGPTPGMVNQWNGVMELSKHFFACPVILQWFGASVKSVPLQHVSLFTVLSRSAP